MDIEEIRRYLPHRYPFLLIDRIVEVEAGSHIRAIKNVSANEPFFQGHFPGKAVMPGVLVMWQARADRLSTESRYRWRLPARGCWSECSLPD